MERSVGIQRSHYLACKVSPTPIIVGTYYREMPDVWEEFRQMPTILSVTDPPPLSHPSIRDCEHRRTMTVVRVSADALQIFTCRPTKHSETTDNDSFLLVC